MITIAKIAAALLVASGLVAWSDAARTSTLKEVATGATILYYNSPAAVQVGQTTAVGYIDATGTVRVASFTQRGALRSDVKVHQYSSPDDHGAPALWVSAGGSLLVATAHHSSDLYLYRLSQNGDSYLICHWQGRFSYPRFDFVDGKLRLYIRIETENAGNFGFVLPDAGCSSPVTLAAAPAGHWIYAVVPKKGRTAWGLYDQVNDKRSGVWLDGEPFALAPSAEAEVLPWSLAADTVAISRFTAAYVCCGKGSLSLELYRGGKVITSIKGLINPHYPNGLVLAEDASEALFPTNDHGLRRRTIQPMRDLPSCAAPGFSFNAQYVTGGRGAYAFVNFAELYGYNTYGQAKVLLCLP